jgi:hypothetical protein
MFTYTVPNSPVTPATGTITYRKASLGWSRPFTDTNVAVYRSNDLGSNRFFLRVNDNGIGAGSFKDAVASGFETMLDVNSGTGQFPLSSALNPTLGGGVIWQKSGTLDSTARAWGIIGDEKTFYLFINTSQHFMYGFGHFIPYRPGDGFNTFIGGNRSPNNGTTHPNERIFGSAIGIEQNQTSVGTFVARSFIQVGPSVPVINTSYHASNLDWGPWNNVNASTNQPKGVTGINAPNQGVFFLPIFLVEPGGGGPHVRGRLPGIYAPWATYPSYTRWSTIEGVDGFPPGTKLMVVNAVSGSAGSTGYFGTAVLFMNITGPWV